MCLPPTTRSACNTLPLGPPRPRTPRSSRHVRLQPEAGERRRVLHLLRDPPRSRLDRIERPLVLPGDHHHQPRHHPRAAANAGSRCPRSSGTTPGSSESVNSQYVHSAPRTVARVRRRVSTELHPQRQQKQPAQGPAGGAGSDGCGCCRCETVYKTRSVASLYEVNIPKYHTLSCTYPRRRNCRNLISCRKNFTLVCGEHGRQN